MANWKYTLKHGVALRKAIMGGNPEDVLDSLSDCFNEINRKMPDYYDESDLADDLDEIDNCRDNLINYAQYDMTYDDAVDSIDYMLDKLYDICDDLRIWVDI